MNQWIWLILSVIGAVYLFIVIGIAFKERRFIAWLAIINIIIFLYTYFFAPELITQLALSGAKVSVGSVYTLITYMFVHGNPAHIFLNTLGLIFFGYRIEKYYGGPQMIFLYFTSGIIAGGFYLLTVPSNIMVIGASGAIFGLMAYLTLIRPFDISPMPFLVPMPVALAAVLYTLAAIPLFMSGDLSGGIAHNAHIGGLVGGTILAFAMNYLQALKGLIIVLIIGIILMLLPPIII